MEYNEEVTRDHPLANYINSLNSLVVSDGGRGIFANEAIAISLDEAEIALRKSSPSPTMDIALGVIKRGTSANPKSKKIVLCEFRFNYKKPKNIDGKNIKNKINYSKSLVQNGYFGSIHNKFYFLFDKKVVAQALHHIGRLFNNNLKDIKIITEEEFKNEFW